MRTNYNLAGDLVSDQRGFRFVGKQEIADLTGLSCETLKQYRLRGRLIEDIHWIKLNSRVVRYNLFLIKDWVQNHNNPQVHQRAIEAYLSSLPSNEKKRRRISSNVEQRQ